MLVRSHIIAVAVAVAPPVAATGTATAVATATGVATGTTDEADVATGRVAMETAAAGWELSCYNEEAMLAAAAALRGGGCDEMETSSFLASAVADSGPVPLCAVAGHGCRTAFQQVQAHHDYCHASDVPAEVAAAFEG